MAFVLDTSVAAAWYLPDERSTHAEQLLLALRDDPPVVPMLFGYELRNVLLMAERRGRISRADVDAALRDVAALRPETVGPDASETALELARRHRLSHYDATYLELARRRALPLATFDRLLADAARAAGCTVLPAPS